MEHLITESFIACLTGTEPKIKKASFDTQKTYPMGILEHWDAIEAMAASNPDLDITAVIEKWMAENPGLPKKKKPTKAATKYWDAFNELAPIDGSAFDYLKDPSAFSPDELVKLEDTLVATYEDRARFDAETGGSFMNLTPHIRIAVGKIYIARGKLVELAALTFATEKHLQKQDPLWDKYEIKGMWAEINRYHKALGREGKRYYDEALNTVIDAEMRSKNNRRKGGK
jgi:hypothetical protein